MHFNKFYIHATRYFVSTAWMILLLFLVGCTHKPDFEVNEKITCDFEELTADNKFFVSSNPGKNILGVDKRTDQVARSGNYAIHQDKMKRFGSTYPIKRPKPGEHYKASIWRKSEHGLGRIAAADDGKKNFFVSNYNIDSIDNDGWERLVLYFSIPQSITTENVRVFTWNQSDEDVYFDDLTIERLPHKPYPEFPGLEKINLIIDTREMEQLRQKREEAFAKHILETEEDDWVRGIMFFNDEMNRVKLRLKGDWLDHLIGEKWSFRIKISKGQTWKGFRTFSIQNPESRDFINEWLLHILCKKEDILAPRYGFVAVNLNGASLGIYAYEEHFEKYLIESNYRREGPIVKLNEDQFWRINWANIKYNTKLNYPVFEAGEILPFKENKTMTSPNLFQQFDIAKDLCYQLKFASQKPDYIIDTEKFARYFAMIDLFGSQHGMIWHNYRFYYNPILCKLEPIAFDNFAKNGPVVYFNDGAIGLFYLRNNTPSQISKIITNFFTDSSFVVHYMNYLEKFSDELYLKQTLADQWPKIKFYDSLINVEYPEYHYDSSYLFNNATIIRQVLPDLRKVLYRKIGFPMHEKYGPDINYDTIIYEELPAYFVKAYKQQLVDSGYIRMFVENYLGQDILLLGTGTRETRISHFIHPEPAVAAFNRNDNWNKDIKVDSASKFLFFMVKDQFTTYVTRIYPWRAPGLLTPLQHLAEHFGNTYLEYFIRGDDNTLFLKEKNTNINKPVILPAGYKVVLQEGDEINLHDSALIISYSPVSIEGQPNNPVVIRSSDGTGNGFTVLQAKEKSIIRHARFDRLNTLNYRGWTLTGAVNFYESDVEIFYSNFENNQCEDALNIIRSDFILDHCKLINTYADALDIDFGSGSITNCEFNYLNNDALDFSGSVVKIEGCRINNAGDKGISCGEGSEAMINNTSIDGAIIGIACKDKSLVEARLCEISNCQYGFVVFRKKPEFGPASMTVSGLKMTGTSVRHLIEEGSSIMLNDTLVEGDKKDLAKIFY